MRNLIVCCDGTWNTPDQTKDGVPIPTNVVLLYNCLAGEDEDGNRQVAYYHPGVGTDGTWWDKIWGGGTGDGLNKNIQSGYNWLCRNYQPGDRVFLFGYSRGAYTVRSLSGLIANYGLLRVEDLEEKEIWRRVQHVFSKGYRGRGKQPRAAVVNKFDFDKNVRVHFLGVWDTVGALGIPDDLAVLNLLEDRDKHTFHDTRLSNKVKHARHAVALDERRGNFFPTLWTQTANHPDVKQVWFPGGHGDVGGGWPERGLSDRALLWMIEEARVHGLAFQGGLVAQLKPDFQDVLHDSLEGVYKLLRTQPRSAPRMEMANLGHALDQSAWDRHETPPIVRAPYRPTRTLQKGDTLRLDVFAREPWNETGIYLEAGGTYHFEATGEWLDGSIPSGPGGASDGDFHAGELVTSLGTVLGKLEAFYKHVTKNDDADFKGTKRVESAPWFCLMGAIANGGLQDDGKPAQHETFAIGASATLKIPANAKHRAGYLYCFANDAWHFYDNNKGSVSLSVTRTA
jgi:hypothetical protein